MNIQMRSLLADVDAAVARERGVRGFLSALPTSHRWLLAALATAVLIAIVRARIPSAVELHFGVRLWTCLIVYALLFGALVAQALRPLQWREPNRRVVLGLGVLALVAPFALAMWPAAPEFAGTPPHDCFPIGGLIGLALIAILRALDRTDEADPRSILFASAAASVAANFALVFHCADDRPLHLLIGHAPVGLALWFAYRKFEQRRARRAATSPTL